MAVSGSVFLDNLKVEKSDMIDERIPRLRALTKAGMFSPAPLPMRLERRVASSELTSARICSALLASFPMGNS